MKPLLTCLLVILLALDVSSGLAANNSNNNNATNPRGRGKDVPAKAIMLNFTNEEAIPGPSDELAASREWKDSTGEHSCQAQLQSVQAGDVTLKKKDSTVTKLSLPKLSKEDQDLVHAFLTRNAFRQMTKAIQAYRQVDLGDTKIQMDEKKKVEDDKLRRKINGRQIRLVFPIKDVGAPEKGISVLTLDAPEIKADGWQFLLTTAKMKMSKDEALRAGSSSVLVVEGRAVIASIGDGSNGRGPGRGLQGNDTSRRGFQGNDTSRRGLQSNDMNVMAYDNVQFILDRLKMTIQHPPPKAEKAAKSDATTASDTPAATAKPGGDTAPGPAAAPGPPAAVATAPPASTVPATPPPTSTGKSAPAPTSPDKSAPVATPPGKPAPTTTASEALDVFDNEKTVPESSDEIATARKWRDSKGEHAVTAQLQSVEAGSVALKKGDGKVVNVPFAKLYKDDQELVGGFLMLSSKRKIAGAVESYFKALAESDAHVTVNERVAEETLCQAVNGKQLRLIFPIKDASVAEDQTRYKLNLGATDFPQGGLSWHSQASSYQSLTKEEVAKIGPSSVLIVQGKVRVEPSSDRREDARRNTKRGRRNDNPGGQGGGGQNSATGQGGTGSQGGSGAPEDDSILSWESLGALPGGGHRTRRVRLYLDNTTTTIQHEQPKAKTTV